MSATKLLIVKSELFVFNTVFTEFVIVIVPFPSVMLFPPVMIAVKLPSVKSKQEGALFEFKLIINKKWM